LTEGIAELPPADASIRAEIDCDAARLGWPAMHERLQQADPVAAQRINPNDSQRIQRALEVYQISGKSLSNWHKEASAATPLPDVEFVKIALQTASRSLLHQRIETRLNLMLNNGFVEEVRTLQKREGLHPDASSMRAVGYRQFWPHVAGECSLADAQQKALVATRQLAKRQLTWLRSESGLTSFDPLEAGAIDAISAYLAKHLS
jgi:tRNA dimethylallyltransferase